MSTMTVTIERMEKPKLVEVEEFDVEFKAEMEDVWPVWKQVNTLIRGYMKKTGFPQPQVKSISEIYSDLESKLPILVAPGIAIEIDEYEQRYGGINLEEYKNKMTPEMFSVFIRYIGYIPGKQGLDIGTIIDTLE